MISYAVTPKAWSNCIKRSRLFSNQILKSVNAKSPLILMLPSLCVRILKFSDHKESVFLVLIKKSAIIMLMSKNGWSLNESLYLEFTLK